MLLEKGQSVRDCDTLCSCPLSPHSVGVRWPDPGFHSKAVLSGKGRVSGHMVSAVVLLLRFTGSVFLRHRAGSGGCTGAVEKLEKSLR